MLSVVWRPFAQAFLVQDTHQPAENERISGRIDAEHAFKQKRIGAGETPGEAFTLVNASVSWRPLADNRSLRLLLSANNIFDIVARRQASMLKDYAPLAGRDIRITLSLGL